MDQWAVIVILHNAPQVWVYQNEKSARAAADGFDIVGMMPCSKLLEVVKQESRKFVDKLDSK